MRKPVSLQLYSVREAAAQDFPGVLKKIAEMGFQGVEPAGFHNLSPTEFRKIVSDLGMKISSAHTGVPDPNELQGAIDLCGELGLSITGGGFGPDDFKTVDSIKIVAEKAQTVASGMKKAGIEFFLHNHWWEFETIDGCLKYDLFLEMCPDIKLEIDTYWSANFGANDPAAMVAKFRDRTPLLHLKDGPLSRDAAHVALGCGKMDIPACVNAADPEILQWVIVELDRCDTDMLDAVHASYRYLAEQGIAPQSK